MAEAEAFTDVPEGPEEIAEWESAHEEVWAGPYAMPRIERGALVLGHERTTAELIYRISDDPRKLSAAQEACVVKLLERIRLLQQGIVTPPETPRVDLQARAKLLAEVRKTPFIHQGVDLRVELDRFLKLPVFQGTKRPTLRVRHGGRGGSGVAYVHSNRIAMTISPDTSMARALYVLLHELVHVSLPPDVHHGERFVLRLCFAAEQAWGVVVDNQWDIKRGHKKNRSYAVGDEITKLLHAKLSTDPSAQPPKVEAPPPVSRVVRAEVLVRKRAEHAAAMLAAHERKLKREQKIVSKWRAKVRYYDKAAAQRKS
jgi:hypothetical protein